MITRVICKNAKVLKGQDFYTLFNEKKLVLLCEDICPICGGAGGQLHDPHHHA